MACSPDEACRLLAGGHVEIDVEIELSVEDVAEICAPTRMKRDGVGFLTPVMHHDPVYLG